MIYASNIATIGYNESRTKSINEVYTMENKLLDWSAYENCEHIPNDGTIATIEETEEIIKRIRAGDYSGCMTLEEYHAETRHFIIQKTF